MIFHVLVIIISNSAFQEVEFRLKFSRLLSSFKEACFLIDFCSITCSSETCQFALKIRTGELCNLRKKHTRPPRKTVKTPNSNFGQFNGPTRGLPRACRCESCTRRPKGHPRGAYCRSRVESGVIYKVNGVVPWMVPWASNFLKIVDIIIWKLFDFIVEKRSRNG